MKALISDIHSNLEALQAVLEDAYTQRAKDIYCLGDMVGYGPNPRECLDLLIDLKIKLILRGNHDDAVYGEPHGFNPPAERALRWTRTNLEADEPESVARRRRFLATLPLTHSENDLLFVHASPRDPLNDYVYPEQVRDPSRMGSLFYMVKRYCFMGHTHVPGIFTEDNKFLRPTDLGHSYQLGSQKVLCNVGSVGQPRDKDKRACYVLLDDHTIYFRRVEYDVAATKKKIKSLRDLDWSYWR